jgi:hypothetical protein
MESIRSHTAPVSIASSRAIDDFPVPRETAENDQHNHCRAPWIIGRYGPPPKPLFRILQKFGTLAGRCAQLPDIRRRLGERLK